MDDKALREAIRRNVAHVEPKQDLIDRIDELEKACAEWAEVSQSNYQRAKAAEAKLAKLRAFLDELWDSQGYDARELHDLLKELDGVSDE